MYLHLLIAILCASLEKTTAIGLAEGIYCGLHSCYDVLGIDREEFNKESLAKIYRKLAMRYHPDRVRDKEKKAEASDMFLKIATAYEVLKDDETRKDYNYYLDNPDERMYNYYQYYRRRVAPKVDIRIVIVVTIISISVVQFVSARHKYQEAIDYATKHEKYRNAAKEIAQEKGIILNDRTIKDKKFRKEYEECLIRQIIEENMDVRGGYSKPSIYSTLAWKILTLPILLLRYVIWYCKWVVKYSIKREEYDNEAKLYLIRKQMCLSEDQFSCLEDKERQSYLDAGLWQKEAYEEWKQMRDEEQKQKLASSSRYKRYMRYMRNHTGSAINFLEE